MTNVTIETPAIDEALKRFFGFDGFRPLQREIVTDVLAGRDVLAVLPTGGGKSLCYQLPALLAPGLTVVISPLIALMHDQVSALRTAGIAGTYLNSTLPPAEEADRLAGLDRGEYDLLYVAPERAALPSFLRCLARWNVARVAVDEAHCISEWGHDFRPEYRRIGELREHLRDVPFLAFTATATAQVRRDIVDGLRLRAPAAYVASFDRPNLTYRVQAKDRAFDTLLAFLRARPGESGIVYAQSRASTESIAERLQHAEIAALPYHAGLAPAVRARNQERFVRDDVQVICATIAFGMGIDKSNVRFVIHHDVPKSIEGYYQETGRAGRDGLPAECLLLFSHADLLKLERFLAESATPATATRARDQLERMKRYAYATGCRRRELLGYFGEPYDKSACGACDNCLEPRGELDATVPAQKLLSCILRIREASGHDVGVTHLVDVLVGAQTEKTLRLGHERLSTYGIGSDFDRTGWRRLADELERLGLIARDADRFNVVTLTPAGREALFGRTPVLIREPASTARPSRSRKPKAASTDLGDADEGVFQRLRRLRRELADARDVPAYVIFSDAVLREMARIIPRSLNDLRTISGVGDRKLAEFGKRFLDELVGRPPV